MDIKTKEAILKVAKYTKDSGMDQGIYTTEECSELIKELMKRSRGKDNFDALVEEACDTLASVSVLLAYLEVPENIIEDKVFFKMNRAATRFEETGKF